MLVCNVVGARPNFMKLTPVVLELMKRGIADKIELWAGGELKTPLPPAGKVSEIQVRGSGLKQGNFYGSIED